MLILKFLIQIFDLVIRDAHKNLSLLLERKLSP